MGVAEGEEPSASEVKWYAQTVWFYLTGVGENEAGQQRGTSCRGKWGRRYTDWNTCIQVQIWGPVTELTARPSSMGVIVLLGLMTRMLMFIGCGSLCHGHAHEHLRYVNTHGSAHDHTIPMPPELKTILLQVMGVFFGTYALRQVRKRSVRSGLVRADIGEGPESRPVSSAADDQPADVRILEFLKSNGPSTPKVIRHNLGLTRSTLTRTLTDLLQQNRLRREATSPRDPNPTYRIA